MTEVTLLELAGVVLAAVLSSTALTALVTGLLNRSKVQAEAVHVGAETLQALDPIVAGWLTRMQTEIVALRLEVSQLRSINQRLLQLLEEHEVPVPATAEFPPS